MSEQESDVDEHLASLDVKETELSQACLHRSAARVASEIRRTAKAERRLVPYLNATFTLMNNALDLLEPETGRDAAIEIISLLESEDRARSIQPDLPEDEYASRVHWLSSCAYDNLAKAVASINGYNSDGVHACISDGIEVCRRTGKLQCITCFREYACDVYRAADDLDMAMHFARVGIAHDKPGPHDRRWAGARDLVRSLLAAGRFEAAAAAAEQTWQLVETWHSPRSSRVQTRLVLREVADLIGEPARWDALLKASPEDAAEPPGEYPWIEMRRGHVEAVAACAAGDYARAIRLLTEWDQRLLRNRCLSEWFETRLRLLAAHRLAGNGPEFERLAAQLEAKARTARDWLTLRCLERLRDPGATISPVPATGDADVGPFAPKKAAAGGDASAGAAEAATAEGGAADADAASVDAGARGVAAMGAVLASGGAEGEAASGAPAADDDDRAPLLPEHWRRFVELHTDEGLDDEARAAGEAAILADMLALDPAAERTTDDARWLLHAAKFVRGDGGQEAEIWEWASRVAQPHRQDAALVSLWATLGAALQLGREDTTEEIVGLEQLDKLFRESLDLDSNGYRNFERAGDFHLFVDNFGEAERCFARAHRLARGYPDAAKKLAEVYRRTDRERDALAVLDMCLREGGDDAGLAWQAGMLANSLDRYEASLTYFDAYETKSPGEPWVNYYRAVALVELERFDEALAAATIEAERNPECPYPSAVLRAAATAGLGRIDEFRTLLEGVLAMRLAEIEYLTFQGLCSLAAILWKAVQKLPADDPLRVRLEDRMLASSTAPNAMFDAARATGEAVEGVNFYECLIRQPLDEHWNDFHGRLAAEADWPAYLVTWGVLAGSEDEAAERVLRWQSRAYPLPAEVRSIDQQADGYRDRPGAVWQGLREVDGGAVE